ncbi:hypothetical protein [Shewanella aestuarii]|uniref:VWFA domain-containing protein n=1 Tax=Shewanella aestuarii TaxID=1028752 RepID=A0A6G9QQL1_9GAMM|nr:hypothetical protein [Shewanella aestuarii]QIR16337.1 hypothetical protein HBH39_17785 [Shewanella aestuarii]
MATQQQLLRKFKNISRVLTRCANMKITFSGNTAWHDDGAINLPLGDFSDDDFVTMSIGYCDHELGHENYTKGEFYERAFKESSFLKGLLNSLDDAHQEARLMDDFKGCKNSLRKLVVLCKDKGIFVKPSIEHSEALILKAWVLYGARLSNDQPLDEYYRIADALLQQKFGNDFYQAIHKIFNPTVMRSINNTEKCYDTAKQIYDLFMAWVDEQESDDDSDDADGSEDSDDTQSDSNDADGSEDSDDTQSDSNDADGSEDSDDTQSDSDDADGSEDSDDTQSDSNDADGSEDSDDTQSDSNDADGSEDSDDTQSNSDDADGSEDSDDTQSDSNDADGSEDSDDSTTNDTTPSDSNEQSKGASDSSMQPVGKKSEILDSLDDDSFDFHAQLREQIAEMAKDYNESFIEPLKAIGRNPVSIDEYGFCNVGDTHRLVSSLKNPLKRIFHDENYCKKSLDKKGATISSSRLSTVVTGNKRIFERESIGRSPNAAISLLVDKSGSMCNSDMRMANSVSYAMSLALDGIKGVKNMVGYYPSYEVDEDGRYINNPNLEIVKTFDKKPKSADFNISGSGGTPTAAAVMTATSYLVNRSEPRKLLFVITDGEPDNIEELRIAIQEANAVGVKVFGIGICHQVHGFEDADFEVIQTEHDLVEALTKGLKHAFK